MLASASRGRGLLRGDRRPGQDAGRLSRRFFRRGGIMRRLVSDDKNGKAETATTGAKPAAKTVVGVPALPEVPPDRPSDMEKTRQLAPKEDSAWPEDDEANTIDSKAMSTAEAEQVLEWAASTQEGVSAAHAPSPHAPSPPAAGSAVGATPRTPGVAGALRPSSYPLAPVATLPLSVDIPGLARTPIHRPSMEPEKPTRPGVAAQA